MRISINKNSLAKALEVASKAVAPKANLQILEGVLLEADKGLYVTGNNIEIAIQCAAECEVTRAGTTVANARLLTDIIKKMPEDEVDITVNYNNMTMTIESGKAVMKIPVLDANGFPVIPEAKANKTFEIDAREFRELVNKVSFAVYALEDRPAMRGVFFHISNSVSSVAACDGHILALRKKEEMGIKDTSFLAIGSDLDKTIKVFEDGKLKISMDSKLILLESTNTKVLLRQIEGEFLNYKKIIPTEFETTAQVKTKDLQLAIERALLLFETDVDMAVRTPVNIAIKGNAFRVSVENKRGSIDDEVSANATGNDLSIRFNPKELIECLKRIEDNELLIKFNGDKNPCVMTPVEGNKFLYLIVPVAPKKG